MRNKMKKIIVSDLDGTLLSYQNGKAIISEENIKMIKLWQKDNYFTIATGRNVYEVKEFLKEAGIIPNTYLICSNGAILYDYDNDVIVNEENMPITYALEILQYFKNNDCGYLSMSTNSDSFNINHQVSVDKYQKIINLIQNKKINKMGYYFKGYPIKEIYNDLSKFAGVEEVDLIFSSDTYLDIQSKTTSKGKALNKLRKHLKEANKIYAIGDYLNDYDLLLNSDLAFAPNNSAKEIIEIADYIVSDCHNHAVAEMVEIIIKEQL